jgi:Lamin Tail Domain
MINPKNTADKYGEYVELMNPTDSPIDIQGWTLSDKRRNIHVIGASVIIPPKGFSVLVRRMQNNGGVDGDYLYKNFNLLNKKDSAILKDQNGVIIDSVIYGKNTEIVVPNGASLQLKSPLLNRTLASSWCVATTPLESGDFGTPGAPNDCVGTNGDPRETPFTPLPTPSPMATVPSPTPPGSIPTNSPTLSPMATTPTSTSLPTPSPTPRIDGGPITNGGSLPPGNGTIGDPTGGGDPHFRTWACEPYAFHGACDLVLLTNPSFEGGKGMDIHIRTRIRQGFSYIQNVALRIGDSIFEVTSDHLRTYYLNGEAGAPMPSSIEGFDIVHDVKDLRVHSFRVHLGGEEVIEIKAWKVFLTVTIHHGSREHFYHSTGMMGSYRAGKNIGRDGHTVFTDPLEYGFEWQVRDTDQTLFHDIQIPQYPQKCVMPKAMEVSAQGRRLGEQISEDKAKSVCSHVGAEDFDFCVFDVMATSDVDMAKAY